MGRLRNYVTEVFALDLRSLAAMRTGLAVVLLVDLAIRAVDLTAMYTNAGFLPRADRVLMYGDGWAYSLYDLTAGSTTATVFLFAIAAIAAIAMALGIGTRVAIAVCWISALGLRLRMPLATTGGDVLLVALLMWSFFLPMDARFSLAARRRGVVPREPITNLATFALLLQIGALFVFAGGAKLSDPSWRAGDGVYYALTAEFYTTTTAAAFLHAAPAWLLQVLTYGVIAFELLAPALLLIPRRRALCRHAFVWGAVFMNLSFWLCLRIGIFSWVVVIGCMAALPSSFWDWVGKKASGTGPHRGPRRGETATATATVVRRLPRPVVGILIALITLMMLNNMRVPRYFGLKRMARVSTQIGLDQRGWPMFSPTARDHGWFILLGQRIDGTAVDLYRGGDPPSGARPALIAGEFATYRRRKYYMNLRRGAQHARDLLLRYHCRRWNSRHKGNEALRSLTLLYLREMTLPDYQTAPARRVILAARACQ